MAAGLVVALLIGACGDDGDEASASSETTVGDNGHVEARFPSRLDADDREVDPNGVFRFAETWPLDSLDPLAYSASPAAYATPGYEPLIGRSLESPSEFEGVLAESWSYSADGRSLDLTIRDGVHFHDGELLTPAGIKANLDRVLGDPIVKAQRGLSGVTAVELVDEHTVRLTQSETNFILHNVLGSLLIVSPNALAGGLDLSTNVVGTGPFRLVSVEPGAKVVYERFDDYWGEADTAGVQRLELLNMPDPQTRLNALRAGEVDGARLTAELASAAEGDGTRLLAVPSGSSVTLQINEASAAFDDVRVRQAVSYALDREGMCATVLEGLCTPTSQLFPEGSPAFDPDLGSLSYPYDPDRARELLAEAGRVDDVSFALLYASDISVYAGLFAEVIQSQLELAGIEVELDGVPAAEAPALFLQRDSFIASTIGYLDPALTLELAFSSDGVANSSHSAPPELDELIASIRAEADDDARARYMRDASRIVTEQVLDVPLVFPLGIFAVSDRVASWTPQQSPLTPGFTHLAMAAG